ncbi:complement component 3 [Plakobranchus ocellatus]|uniref:Complement component 3 n=1 Tax=Plakobranchus ocellatus TaxID=259542 RepID=A0AAV3YK95_9GAST|nr:complement component 3 [Plakobranchus ocellatus]
MARWITLSLVAAFLLNSILLVCGTKYLVTLPRKLQYDSEVVATITAVGVPPGGDYITLTYRGAKDTSRKLNETVLEFKRDGVDRWGVVFPWKRIQEIEENGVVFVIGNKEIKLRFDQDPGYIFIQTDKPIYSPRQAVKFRIIAVDEYQRLAKYPVKVDIKNPDDIIVDRMRYSAEEAFKGQQFDLPREATQGFWSISANFEGLDNTFSESKTVEFEVREYVLPRFSANLQVSIDVITRDTDWINFLVTGKYVYGRPVQGRVEIQLGVWDENDGVSLLPHRYSGEMKDGEYRAYSRMTRVFPPDKTFPKGKRLYVSANVTETGTGENHTIVDTSTFISQPYYFVDFQNADENFKPGFPFTLKADVKSMSGIPTPGVDIAIKYSIKDKRGIELRIPRHSKKQFYRKADKNGRMVETFDLPQQTNSVEFVVSVLDWARNTYNSYKYSPYKLFSKSKEYIHISMTSPIKTRRDGKVRLLYTKASASPRSASATPTYITIQVLSKGQVVHMDSTVKNADGRSIVKLPKFLYKQVSPSMRIVAYYHVQGEFVMDSLLVDTKDTCLEELQLSKPGGWLGSPLPYLPKEKYEMEIYGGSYMRVGLVAVDEAVFLLNDKQTLTRESFFEDLNRHDLGRGEGDGRDFTSVLFNSGLEQIMYDTEEEETFRTGHFMEVPPNIAGMQGPKLPFVVNKNNDKISKGIRKHKHERPQTVRSYFPESWLFEEITLPKNGSAILKNVFLPDSITTWNFMAVGLSKTRGVCVSEPHRQAVEKLFFADVRMPYKVTRLEEVKVKIAIYNYKNYPLKISGHVSGIDGICFSANSMRGQPDDEYLFSVTVPSRGIVTEVVKIIPLKNGDLTLRVDLQSRSESDVVERKLHVVAEGLRVRKSITFVLDPEAKHVTYKDAYKEKITVKNSATVNNIFDVKKKEQNTTIDLALPEEVILGTDTCRIAAFGDLMGDIITHAIVQSKSLVDQPMADAEEVLGDLGPTVHALLYVNQTGLANEELAEKGRRFISHSVARLLKYREGAFFRLTPKSKPATWLTATVLKTLCFASKLTFVDKANLIDRGFTWLSGKFQYWDKGTVEELDWRLSKDSLDYRVMLSAEVLIALLQCERFDLEEHANLMSDLALYLEDNIHRIQEPMVLAKAAYALMLFDPESEIASRAAKRLWSTRRSNENGQIYWSDEKVVETESIPFWYQLGAKASAIEATSYALLVFLEAGSSVNADAIADWLVGQRNQNGAFIGAMDSMAAIQALSSYSLKKREQERLEIDLSCNISSEKSSSAYEHSFKFTQQDATSKKSVNNVPVGKKLEVLTKGQGLGQMHVDVEYNIPIDKNANCLFNVSVEVKPTEVRWMEDMKSNPLCFACNIGCEDKTEGEDVETVNRDDKEKEIKQPFVFMEPPPPPRVSRLRKAERTNRPSRKIRLNHPSRKSRPTFPHRQSNLPLPPPSGADPVGPPGPSSRVGNAGHGASRQHKRQARSLRSLPAASKRSICIHVCLRYLKDDDSGPTSVELEMLTGYRPVVPDVERISNLPGIRNAEFVPDRDILVVQFDKIAHDEETCFALRAVDEEEVGRPTPASLIVKETGRPQPSCFLEYNPPAGEESLQVFCADFSHSNRGECRCYSGVCSSCLPIPHIHDGLDYDVVKKYACNSEVVYEVELTGGQGKDQWMEIDATVVHGNRTGSHEINAGDAIKMITPSSCYCPHFVYSPESMKGYDKIYLLSPDVEKLVDRKGQSVYRYLLDEKSQFLRVRADNNWSSSSSDPTVPMLHLYRALRESDTCNN